jgi:hypothetical protein
MSNFEFCIQLLDGRNLGIPGVEEVSNNKMHEVTVDLIHDLEWASQPNGRLFSHLFSHSVTGGTLK